MMLKLPIPTANKDLPFCSLEIKIGFSSTFKFLNEFLSCDRYKQGQQKTTI